MRIILAGYGNVGRNLHRIIEERRRELLRRFFLDLNVVAVVDRGGAVVHQRGVPYREASAAKEKYGSVARADHGRPDADVAEVLEEVDADVYVDTTLPNFRDGQPSISYMNAAMLRGMHVVTSNKAPLALAMPALLEMAEYRRVKLLYSGTVGGGTPFLSTASESLRGNRIRAVRGILNGTSNYILHRMETEGTSLEEALEEARRLGYAEADASLDIGGMDAAAKLVILTNHSMGSRYTLKDVRYSGIEGAAPRDLLDAAKRGRALRLLADSRGLRVGMEEIDAKSPLNVPANLNSVEFDVEELGSIYLIGRGAGGPETAAAVLRDIVQLSS
ncbi:MAG: homoserine dehydrogenase [Conexivisphaera sp.]|jgi:homoserine dehydrogenase|nr:homoserine dehydrogenase [Conexivisphaerales archaeon]